MLSRCLKTGGCECLDSLDFLTCAKQQFYLYVYLEDGVFYLCEVRGCIYEIGLPLDLYQKCIPNWYLEVMTGHLL